MSDGIRIPTELLPADGRFGAGPSKVRQAQVDALASVWQTYLGTSHRQKAVKSEVGRLRSGLRDLFALPDGYEVVLGNGGSTAFWDIATFGLLDNRAQFLSFGEFGAKFASGAAKAPHLGEPTIITADPGTAPAFTAEAGIDVLLSAQRDLDRAIAFHAESPGQTPMHHAGRRDQGLGTMSKQPSSTCTTSLLKIVGSDGGSIALCPGGSCPVGAHQGLPALDS